MQFWEGIEQSSDTYLHFHPRNWCTEAQMDSEAKRKVLLSICSHGIEVFGIREFSVVVICTYNVEDDL